MASLPPKYVPPVPDDEEDEGDTLVEGLEQDSFDATLMGEGPASVATPIADRLAVAAKALEAITEEVVERIDEAMLSLAEQRLVRPLYAIGGAIAVRAMIVPAFVVFLVGVWVGTPGAALEKTYPKTVAELAPAASAPVVAALPAPVVAPTVEPPVEAALAPEPAAPVATPARASRAAIAVRRTRTRRRAQARRTRRRRGHTPPRRARRRR